MNKLICLAGLLVLCTVQLCAAQKRVVCYHTNWSQYRPEGGKFFPENIDPFLCTHVIYSFAKLQNNALFPYEWNDESTEWSKGLYERTMDLKKVNPSLKILIAVGGWSMGSTDFSNLVNSASLRRSFVSSSIEFLRKHGFDGLDLDWEYPSNREGSRPQDKQLFSVFVEELKAAYSQNNLLLTAAVGVGKETADTAYEVSIIARHLDFINLMTYDLHGSWETFTGHNSPLFGRADEVDEKQKTLNIDWAANYWVSHGASKDKLNIGLATYGRSFRLASSATHMGAPTSGTASAGTYTREGGFLAYYEICQKLSQGWTRVFHNEHRSPYAYGNSEWVGYDDVQSLTEKAAYIKEMGFGGAMFWALDLDDFNGQFCNQGKYPLINAVKSALNGNSPVTSGPSTSPAVTQQQSSTTASTTTTTRPISSTSGPVIVNLDCPRGDGTYGDVTTGCKNYYVCVYTGTQFFQINTFTCPEGTIYDANYQSCNWASATTCRQ